MLAGSVLGGVVAQFTNLGVPFLFRAGILALMLVVAFFTMRDIGFTPDKSETPLKAVRTVFRGSIRHGLGNPPVRYLMLAAPFTAGVGIYVFYALQPYLLQLWGDPTAYSIAGLAAAIIAGSQIVGGILAPLARRLFKKRTTVLILSTVIGVVLLLALGLITNFWVALIILVVWGVASSIDDPIRRAYMNGLIPSNQRATVLSFESLMGNVGGIGIQPALGRVADLSGYAFSLVIGGVISAVAVPFIALSRKQNAPADIATTEEDVAPAP
jgi:MFS family permease